MSLFTADMPVCIYHIYHVIKHGMEAENGKKWSKCNECKKQSERINQTCMIQFI